MLLKMSQAKVLVFGIVLAFGLVGKVSAGLITFTDETTWLTAVGSSPTTLEDFESYVADEDFSLGTSTSPNGFSITHNGPSGFRNFIDVSPFDFPDGNGTNSLSLFVNFDGVDTVTITFDSLLRAFAFDSSSAAGGEGAQVEIFDSSSISLGIVALTNGIDDFFGFIADGGDHIASATFSAVTENVGSGGEGFQLDRVQTVDSVPEPGSLALLGLGLAGLVFTRRKKA